MCTALKVSTHGLYHPDEDDSSQDSSRCCALHEVAMFSLQFPPTDQKQADEGVWRL